MLQLKKTYDLCDHHDGIEAAVNNDHESLFKEAIEEHNKFLLRFIWDLKSFRFKFISTHLKI